MIGVVIVGHDRLPEEFLQALRGIVGADECAHIHAVGLDPTTTSPEDMRSRIDKALREADQGNGVLIVADMFGGTPSNLAMAFLEEGRVEVVTGVNLPMLVKVARLREELPILETAELARDYGRRNISVASDVLSGRDQ